MVMRRTYGVTVDELFDRYPSPDGFTPKPWTRGTDMLKQILDGQARTQAIMSAPVVAPPEPTKAPQLTDLQTVALLRMVRLPAWCFTTCRAMADFLAAECQDRPSHTDYAVLAERGWCERPHGDKWHKITMAGTAHASTIATNIARVKGLHILIETPAGWETSYRCVCGEWRVKARRSAIGARNSYAKFAVHVAEKSEARCDTA